MLACGKEIVDGPLMTIVKEGCCVMEILELLLKEVGLRIILRKVHIAEETGKLRFSDVILDSGTNR
jgi:hypothetical protein